MGNPDHLKELLKGVEHWNAWRKTQGDSFKPDFRGTHFPSAFRDSVELRPFVSGVPSDAILLEDAHLSSANLSDCDLEGAYLGGAKLDGANLSGTVLEGAEVSEASFRNANLTRAILWRTNMFHTDLSNADLTRADLRGANAEHANFASATLAGAVFMRTDLEDAAFEQAKAFSIVEKDGTTKACDFSQAKYLTQEMIDEMVGDTHTILPDGFERPAHWSKRSSALPTEADVKSPSPVGFTAPVEFETQGEPIEIRHNPVRPSPRSASRTPIDEDRNKAVRLGLSDGFGTLARNFRRYAKEDRSVSNRVGPAEALLGYVEALQRALKADPFLPSVFQDYVEIIDQGFAEEVHAFEAGDRVAVQQLVKRARDHYAGYPELPEINDPSNTGRIREDFPYSVASLEAEISEIVYSAEGFEIFSDSTRETFEAEKAAYPPANADPDKSRLARNGAIVGEMWREMAPKAEEMRKAADKGAARAQAWVNTFEKVRKVWEAIEPWLGLGG